MTLQSSHSTFAGSWRCYTSVRHTALGKMKREACETPTAGLLSGARCLRAYRPVLSPASAGSGWRWIQSGRCSSPQTGGCSCPRCLTAFCLEAVKSSSIIFTFESHCWGLYVVPICYTPKPPPSHCHWAHENCASNKLEGGNLILTQTF